MTCNAIYRQKARIKSKTSVAQTGSQLVVYAKGLNSSWNSILVKCLFLFTMVLYRRSWTSLPSPFESAQRLSERTVEGWCANWEGFGLRGVLSCLPCVKRNIGTYIYVVWLCYSSFTVLAYLCILQVREEQVVMAHSPLKMFQQYHHKRVLISGQGPIVEIAKNLYHLSRSGFICPRNVKLIDFILRKSQNI
jgi:hypothetical protein